MVDVRTNLLKNRQVLSEKDYQRERDLLKMSVIGSTVVVIVVVALSIWSLVLTAQLSRIDAAVKKVTVEIQGLTKASAQQIYLKSRLQLVTDFLSARSVTRESLQKIFSVNISGVHISRVSFDSDTILGVQYSVDSRTSLDELIAYYELDTGYFTQAVSKGLSRDKDGVYQISFSLKLPKGGN